ncbi:hypothetical protein [Lichenicoccus roseus]|uniref:hypothetical protein n=1 Tax=Lichenicoccus roseus TaxID=2683649 RepID=UPI001F10CEAB|nr:hypothetical protein [Lichenicoccus roseus]
MKQHHIRPPLENAMHGLPGWCHGNLPVPGPATLATFGSMSLFDHDRSDQVVYQQLITKTGQVDGAWRVPKALQRQA